MTNNASIIQKTKHRYTMVEMLAVIGLMAIIMAIGSAAISTITTKRGVNGGVSMVGAQVNLARSVAVAKNSYIALLLPATGSHAGFKDRFFKSMRLCYVKRSPHDVLEYQTFVFSDWVEDHYWVDLPSKVCANLVNGKDKADISGRKYEVKTIKEVPPGPKNASCYAVIFNPSGSLVSGGNALIQVYPGITKADGSVVMLGLGGSTWLEQDKGKLKNRRWCVEINRFTGRSRTSYAQVEK